MPTELADKAKKILDKEPVHPARPVAFSQTDFEREPFTLRSFLAPKRTQMVIAIILVVLETVALQAGPPDPDRRRPRDPARQQTPTRDRERHLISASSFSMRCWPASASSSPGVSVKT
ncbi:MAG: hypothetical protein R2706_13455 [Acidimicrobiales bacterium]